MKCERLNWDLLVRTVDQELSSTEMEWVPAHLAECSDCRRECIAIRDLSQGVETLLDRLPVVERMDDREQLAKLRPNRQSPGRVIRRFGWGMAIAATLAIGIIVAPKQRTAVAEKPPVEQAASSASNAIEVDGETFVALPYSNPDLPSAAPRIVQMQVPVASLADVGLGLEQVASEVANQDRTVLADVLLGADGQPLGVHVLSWE